VLDELVSAGGCTTGLFVTDSVSGGIRSTKDVDAIVNVTSYAEYTSLAERLRALGLAEDSTPGAPPCRWRRDASVADVMPINARVLGFSNRWYPAAIETAQCWRIAGHDVRIVTPALFIAAKLQAFRGRGGGVATEDLAVAVSYILDHAATLGVGTGGYSLWGSSAGARMAAAIGSHGAARYGGRAVPKPSTVVMAYTAHSDYASAEPPTFVVVGEEDGIAPPAVMQRRVDALRKSGSRVEFRRFKGLGHGFGLGTGTSAEGWVVEAVRFWEASMPR
jgi:pimeloyl-ACP methyl ester carboxylesterase